MARIYDMKQKEVINIRDGCRFGYMCDIEIDIEEGKLVKIIVPGPGRVLGVFGRDQEYRIPWDHVNRIGDDIILVECDSGGVLVESEE